MTMDTKYLLLWKHTDEAHLAQTIHAPRRRRTSITLCTAGSCWSPYLRVASRTGWGPWDGATPSHHPFLVGIFPYKANILGMEPPFLTGKDVNWKSFLWWCKAPRFDCKPSSKSSSHGKVYAIFGECNMSESNHRKETTRPAMMWTRGPARTRR